MNKRPQLAVVVGEMVQPRFLAFFEPLTDAFDVCVFALDTEGLIDSHGTSLKLRVFENIEDMPGYMRGLEEELVDFDAIIALETSRLSTFQAVRASRKFLIPLGVVVNEYRPFFYESFQNIRAIQYDICNKANAFWPTSSQAADCLRLDHVEEGFIKSIAPVIDNTTYRLDRGLRKKFRDYIRLQEDDFVVLFYGDLEEYAHPMDVLHATALLNRHAGDGAEKVKLIFAGNGSKSMDLKYRSFDKGLGNSVMFLHQSPENFLVDMYNASDVIVSPRPSKCDFHEDLPLQVLEAMACGVVPVVTSGSVAHELAGPTAIAATDDSFQAIYMALKKLHDNKMFRQQLSVACVERIHNNFSRNSSGKALIADAWVLIEEGRERRTESFDIKDFAETIERHLKKGQESDALLAVEDALLTQKESTNNLASIYQLRGDIYFAQGEIEQAMQSYTSSVQLDDRQNASYRGLGFVSWQSHSNEEALTFFRKALAIKDDDQMTNLGIGLVYRRLGLIEESLFWLEKAVAHDSSSSRAIMALSQACLECTVPESGIEVLERVIEVIGENTSLMMSLGQLYINMGQSETGRMYLQKAMAS
jgi:glycosyltransferase involved in cell wall biosynthesis